jgi:hypothetical protein
MPHSSVEETTHFTRSSTFHLPFRSPNPPTHPVARTPLIPEYLAHKYLVLSLYIKYSFFNLTTSLHPPHSLAILLTMPSTYLLTYPPPATLHTPYPFSQPTLHLPPPPTLLALHTPCTLLFNCSSPLVSLYSTSKLQFEPPLHLPVSPPTVQAWPPPYYLTFTSIPTPTSPPPDPHTIPPPLPPAITFIYP